MNYKTTKFKGIFYLLFVINLLISLFSIYLLPSKYFNDADYITQRNHNFSEEIGSYTFTIKFYELTNLSYLSYPIVALIQFSILMFLLAKIGIPENFHKVNIKNILIYISIFMLSIFVSMPSKEFITFIFLSIIVFLFQKEYNHKKKIIISIALFIFFGLQFRIYFVLIPILSIGMFFVSNLRINNKVFFTILSGVFVIMLISLFYGNFISDEYLSQSSREFVNQYRMHSNEAQSIIISPVKTNTWYGEWIGIIYGFFSVNLPFIEIVKHIFKIQVLAFVIWQLLIFYIVIIKFRIALKDSKNKKIEIWTILFLLSFFIIQGVFEPDLGTATRHKIGFLPLIYFIFYYDYIGKDK